MIRSRTGSDPRVPGVAAALAIVTILGVAPARAGEPGNARAIAEALFREGKKLLDKGQIDEACAKLESSYHIDEALGTLLNVASCHEKQGKLATAWGEYSEALSIARKAGQASRQKFASEHIAAIEPRLSRLTVRVPPEAQADGIEVTVDTVALSRGAWGSPIPVDPGDHQVAVSAPGRARWEAKETVKPAEALEVVVPSLVVLPPPIAALPPPPRSVWKLPVGLAALGVGAVGLAVGTFFGVHAFSLAGQSRLGCAPNGGCTPAGYQAFQSGNAAATNADVLVIVGVAAAGAGVVLVILDAVERRAAPRPAQAATSTLRAAPLLAPGVGLMTFGGSW